MPEAFTKHFYLAPKVGMQDFFSSANGKSGISWAHSVIANLQISLVLYGSRCTQLPLIEKLIQWLSGPSSSLSVATDRPRDTGPDSNDVRARSIYSTNSVDDINAQSG
jgi:hypothetical protein